MTHEHRIAAKVTGVAAAGLAVDAVVAHFFGSKVATDLLLSFIFLGIVYAITWLANT